MSKELREKLEAALSLKGLNKELDNFIVLTDENEIDGTIAQLSALQGQPQTDLDIFLKDNPTQKSEFDRRMTKAIDTFKKGQKPVLEEPIKVIDEPQWAIDLKKQVLGLESEKALNGVRELAKSSFTKSELPDFMFGQLSFVTETTQEEIDAQISELKTTFEDYEQGLINKHTGANGLPNALNGKGELTDAEADDYIK